MTPWTNTTAVHLERQLRRGLGALEGAASLEERQAQVMQLRVMATPANLAALLRLLDEARATPRAEEHTLPVAGPATPAAAAGVSDAVSGYVCSNCKNPLKAGWVCDHCDSEEAEPNLATPAAAAEPSDARVHDVEEAFDHFKVWPTVTAINNLRMKLDDAERYIHLLKGVASL